MINDSMLCEAGYTIIDLKGTENIYFIQNLIEEVFKCLPTEIHLKKIPNENMLPMVKEAKDRIVQAGCIKELLIANSELLIKLFGQDIDFQPNIHLRISRPGTEGDIIDWHRDTFYGNSHWEMNFWLPIFPLEEGVGLIVIEGSHLLHSKKIYLMRDLVEGKIDAEKGSIANELGYPYLSKTDDVILELAESKSKLITPKLGQAIFFFGHLAHRAQNLSSKTRVSIDLRVKQSLAPTNTKQGYYCPLIRSSVTHCIEKMLSQSDITEYDSSYR